MNGDNFLISSLCSDFGIVEPIKQIEVGDVLCEIETDKATLEFESLEEG